MNAVAYLRVSTEEQRLGPEAQRAAIEVWAKANAVTIVSWHLDQGLSGGLEIDYRPGLAEAIGAIKAHRATLLVVAKRDRLARDVYIAATIDRAVSRQGARIVSAGGEANGDTPADAFMRSILDGAAAYERAMIRGRTKAALAAKRREANASGACRSGIGRSEASSNRTTASKRSLLRCSRRVRVVSACAASCANSRRRGCGRVRGSRSRSRK
jgi:DNA invertase Pin-like site-specific DNA recombinase